MRQLSLDNRGTIADQIEAAAEVYGAISVSGLMDFARYCRQEGYLDDIDPSDSLARGDMSTIKKVFKRSGKGGLRLWICTGEGIEGEWIPRRLSEKTQHTSYCCLLQKKYDDIGTQLVLELEYHEDRWNEKLTPGDLIG